MNPQSTSQSISVWHYKPWWCQPWSIALTGVGIISGSWFLFQTIWITLLIAMPTLTWMLFFLVVYPRSVNRVEVNQVQPSQIQE
jgi:hypothetical protein